MRVALVHDYIKEYGGAERVLEALHEIWPNAPVFTAVYLPDFLGPHEKRFRKWNIKTSWLQFLPFKSKLISPIRLIAPFVFRQFNFSQFDAVIVSATGAYISNAASEKRQAKSRPIFITYCHTPPRYLYGFATAREWKKNLILRSIGEIANHFLRLIDFKSAQNVDFFIANSKNVAGRIKKFYRRDSTVIYPPVDLLAGLPRWRTMKNSPHTNPPHTYFLAGGRLARPKHIDLIVQTFEKLDLPLVVFGREFAGQNFPLRQVFAGQAKIRFVGEIADEEKLVLMRNAKAFVFAAEDEDFGITPVEAMSMGTPVIAFASGGAVETIINGKTGIFYHLNDLSNLSEAMRQFERMKFDRELIIKHAEKFSKERFKKKIEEFVSKLT